MLSTVWRKPKCKFLAPCAEAQAFHIETPMMDIALFRLPGGRAWIGQGPFENFAQAPAGGGAFYVNDFDLQDPLPWKRPAKLVEVTPESLAGQAGWNGAQPPLIAWSKPATEWFKMAFRRIRREVLARRLEKMVPVLTERGTISTGDPVRLLEKVLTAPDNTWGYGFVQNGSVYCPMHGFFEMSKADFRNELKDNDAKEAIHNLERDTEFDDLK
jgi:hypothetical protein